MYFSAIFASFYPYLVRSHKDVWKDFHKRFFLTDQMYIKRFKLFAEIADTDHFRVFFNPQTCGSLRIYDWVSGAGCLSNPADDSLLV